MASTCYLYQNNNYIEEKLRQYSRETTSQILQLDRNLIDIMGDVKRQTTPIYDDSFINHELDKQDLSTFEADRRRDTI
eukprot:4925289-Amphidinium_carterae.4